MGAAVVDSETGLILGQIGANGGDLEICAAGSMDLVRGARRMVNALEIDDDVEDVIVSLQAQYHLARTVRKNPAIFIYLRLDRQAANLGLARLTLQRVEDAIAV